MIAVLTFQVYHPSRQDRVAGLFNVQPASSSLIFAKGDSPSFITPHGLGRLAGDGTKGFCFMRFENMVGKRYGLLQVTSEYRNNKRTVCDVICDCGAVKTVSADSLRRGLTLSCGCLVKRKGRNATHGLRDTPEYESWAHLCQRTLNSNAVGYDNYGGRGITVCEYYRNFENFFNDVGERPEPKYLYSIDRVDNNGGYWCGKCPECIAKRQSFNVRWATKSEQAFNHRPKRRVS